MPNFSLDTALTARSAVRDANVARRKWMLDALRLPHIDNHDPKRTGP